MEHTLGWLHYYNQVFKKKMPSISNVSVVATNTPGIDNDLVSLCFTIHFMTHPSPQGRTSSFLAPSAREEGVTARLLQRLGKSVLFGLVTESVEVEDTVKGTLRLAYSFFEHSQTRKMLPLQTSVLNMNQSSYLEYVSGFGAGMGFETGAVAHRGERDVFCKHPDLGDGEPRVTIVKRQQSSCQPPHETDMNTAGRLTKARAVQARQQCRQGMCVALSFLYSTSPTCTKSSPLVHTTTTQRRPPEPAHCTDTNLSKGRRGKAYRTGEGRRRHEAASRRGEGGACSHL